MSILVILIADLGSLTKITLSITLSIMAFQRISVELQLQSNFIGLKLQWNY